MLALLAAALLAMLPAPVATQPATAPQAKWPIREADFAVRDFRFRSGETLPTLRLHYATLGTPHRGEDGAIDNAVMLLHGTGGSGRQFLSPQFADELFGPGQPLDITRHFIILPDGIGHGASSKPSDGLRMRFPRYDYADMVEAQHRMLVDGLGVARLQLLFGTSMGCMHAFVWGEAYPGFAARMMPMACLPIEIAGQNRMWRVLAMEGIRRDPAWAGGDYRAEPVQGLRTAASLLAIAGGAPVGLQHDYPTRAAAESYAVDRVAKDIGSRDANDLLYQLDASRSYDPSADLARITVPVRWINSADDFINPRNLGVAEAAVRQMPNARFRLISETAETHGHGTHTWARFWKEDMAALLATPIAGRRL